MPTPVTELVRALGTNLWNMWKHKIAEVIAEVK